MNYSSSWEKAQTSVIEYRHPAHMGKITLVGALHLGSRDYYKTLQGIIDDTEQAGGIVHHEGIKPASPDELSAATPKDQAKEHRFNETLTAIENELYVATAFNGLVRQRDALKPSGKWQCHDATSLQIAQHIGDQELDDMSHQVEQALNPSPEALAFTQILKDMRAESDDEPEDKYQEIRRLIATLNDPYDERPYWMTGFREDIQLGAMDEHIVSRPGTDLTMVWGEKHLPSFEEGLYNRDYRVANEQQLVAIDLAQIASSNTEYS